MESLNYKGYALNIRFDSCPENPFEAWDFEPPVVVKHGNQLRVYGDIHPIPTLTEDKVRKHWKSLLDAIEVRSFLTGEARGFSPDWRGLKEYAKEYADQNCFLWESLRSDWEEAIGDNLDACAEAWNMVGVPALCAPSCGYSQGDYAEVLVVATPEWCKGVGASSVSDDLLQNTVDLYSAWAWGDVYGCEVLRPDGVRVDSCWGFYGADHEESGLMDFARQTVDSDVAEQEKEALEVAYWQSRGVETVAV